MEIVIIYSVIYKGVESIRFKTRDDSGVTYSEPSTSWLQVFRCLDQGTILRRGKSHGNTGTVPPEPTLRPPYRNSLWVVVRKTRY